MPRREQSTRFEEHIWTRHRRVVARMVVGRLAVIVPMIAMVSLAVFFLSSLSPLDPLTAIAGDRAERLNDAQRAQLGAALGLDVSWFEAWTTWMSQTIQGDFGMSRVFSQPVADVIGERAPWSLLLGVSGMGIALLLGVGTGAYAGMREYSRMGRLFERSAVVIQAVPPFVLSLGAITVMSVGLGWFPAGGAHDIGNNSATSVAHHLVLPAIVLGLSQFPWVALATRAAVVGALSSDAVRFAYARGLSHTQVLRGHVLPVSFAPVVTLIGARLPELLVGGAIVEEVFSWPGIASALLQSATQLDFSLLAVLVLATTLLVLLGSLISDVVCVFLDPRVSAHE